jgi:hypothetical protein
MRVLSGELRTLRRDFLWITPSKTLLSHWNGSMRDGSAVVNSFSGKEPLGALVRRFVSY